MTKKTPQNRFQLNEKIEKTLSAPISASAGSRIPSILQCTLPQDLPLMKHPTPAHATEIDHSTPVDASERTEASYASEAINVRTAGTPQRR